ncbi:MAG: aminopeptidase P family protein [Methanomicrobiales archaeon HGW-Methanomicrobiales-1]|nr:MAG: aminopeptidase P family protein [Methanomicrobiales archaeon HGW-Methanomicrobiales-1]
MDTLSRAVRKSGADAFVMYASSRDADMRYLTQFVTSDPFVYFKKANENGMIIISQMETGRASRESTASVMTRTQAGLPDILKTEKDPWKATAKMIAGQVGKKVLVPPNFPVALANALGEFCTVLVDSGTVPAMREKKSRNEIQAMKHVQKITETAMGIAVSLIRHSSVKNGILHSDGKPLTSEMIKFSMHSYLLEHGCTAVDTIVSCGEETAVPHITGTGPLHADNPIVIDLFPCEEKTGYYADMTRTVVKGEPTPEIREMYAALCEAKQLGISRVRAGAYGSDIYQSVVDFFKERGYDSDTRGFVHNLGHGVGLQVHELPTVGPAGKELRAGSVITIEPGLYYPKIGGVRLEDIGEVTTKGFNNFTQFPEDLVV